jgi:hypothetical protein
MTNISDVDALVKPDEGYNGRMFQLRFLMLQQTGNQKTFPGKAVEKLFSPELMAKFNFSGKSLRHPSKKVIPDALRMEILHTVYKYFSHEEVNGKVMIETMNGVFNLKHRKFNAPRKDRPVE